ncbi:hypothetical protein ACFQPF_14220 [Fictibacillus iocasae]|uniref:Uncharacterized protein n=1 Tax=Fictibacillus iocasae TaxID=2715437 RepID=A0ABW2NXS2_9BACL
MKTFLKRTIGPNAAVLLTLLFLPVFLITDNVDMLQQMIDYLNRED